MKFSLADLFEQDEKAKVDLHHPTKYRYHCLVCGRFVPFSSVRKYESRWGEFEPSYMGKCSQDDVVEVTWGEQ